MTIGKKKKEYCGKEAMKTVMKIAAQCGKLNISCCLDFM